MPSDCCYFVVKAAAADAAPALNYFSSILHRSAVFTQNLGQTLQEVPERFFWHTTVSHAPTDTIWPAHRTFDSIAPSAAIIPYVIHALQCYHHLAL